MPNAELSEFAVHLRRNDNVAVAARPIAAGTVLLHDGKTIETRDDIAMGHKFAVQRIPKGQAIYKYGQVIGFATGDISAGEHVHTHNVAAELFERDYAFCSERPEPPTATEERYFLGYDRGDGRVGTRNYLAIISTVNCSASTSKYVAQEVRDRGMLADYPNIDGVIAITHKTGCGLQYEGPDHEQLERVLSGFARHANVVDFLLIGLGCEIAQTAHLVERQQLLAIRGKNGDSRVLTIQECGGIRKTVEAALRRINRMLPAANDVRRTKVPASRLIVGTQCGGSDGNSGVTANPALGIAADMIVAQGGTVMLAETPEIYGAEHLLTRRAVSREVGEKLVERIKWWEWYTSTFGAQINNNPTPGNKAGGLTTIYEKSLGAIAKAGSTALVDVLRYAEAPKKRGMMVMDTPGYDPVSMTGLVAGGANVLVFTTGRGSVFGCKPTPSIKVATNTPTYQHMCDDMDINAGVILEGTPVEVVGKQIFEEILAVASGKKTKSELAGVGEEEFAPWTIGPTL